MKLAVFSFAFMLFVALSSSFVCAENTDSIILVTDASYPDTLVSGAAANEAGAPVLLTGEDELPSETDEEISSASPETVYIIGGPAVVSEAVENRLKNSHMVVRLWGMTRYGTAVKIAEHFWDEAPRVILVWDSLGTPGSGNAGMLAEARDLAVQEGIPVLLTRKTSVPEQVVDALVNLSTQSVILIGNVDDSVTETLSELGITVEEHIKGEDASATRTLLRQRSINKIKSRTERPLVVVAAGSWSDNIKAPFITNGTSRIITSEDQIEDLISEVTDVDYTRIVVVGKPDLAAAIKSDLDAAGINSTHVTGATAAAVARKVMQAEKAKLRLRAAAVKERISAMDRARVMAVMNNTQALVDSARDMLRRAGVASAVRDRVVNSLDSIKDSVARRIREGNYTEAWHKYKELQESSGDRLLWNYRDRLTTAYNNLVKKETRLTTVVNAVKRKIRVNSLSAAAAS